MANEATLKLKRSEPIDMKCNETAIEKGTLLKFSGDREIAASSSTDVFAGVARREKIAGDGRTQLSVFTGPGDVFDMRAGGGTTISVGELVKLSGANLIEGDVVEADIIAGKVVGKALEAATVGTASTIEVMLT